MFQRFKSHFARQSATPQKSPGQQPETMRDRRGYFRPQSTDELLATPLRRQCLQQLWQNSALPEGLYQRFYLAPVKQLLGSVQQVPATPEGGWSGAGGFADLTLQFTACAVRLAKGHLLPPGAAPETQAAQGLLWQAIVFWAALFYHLPLLRQLEGELEDGHVWQPGIGIPDKPFRFRFRTPENALTVPQEALLAASLLPEKAITWLVSVPEAWHCLMLHLNGRPSSVPLIDALLQEAAGQVHSPLVKQAVLPAAAETAQTSEADAKPETPSAAPATEMKNPSPSTADDTRTLLSLFQSNDEVSLLINANENDNDLKIGKRTGRLSENVAPAGNESS
ncbi:TraI domain-containing protein [Xenorhabdus griffiniae]|uniref:TraI domain-containing protein n=1 Tax=Xenorhabdus griffiniae TaxID=351672 RepID=A0ABY9XEX5_9GAMM|nr:TraI domain-containing protein [Xenorhabdus griffiniae]MBD1228747.1 TraI domain-containing protein [Xenorhabdus griffiniae]MBE8588668.1 TraI domain-containing protein [Xenorhabdus griffiniae]WMV71473.1 TraI domain-containing protein [Xenorhabdus griffiniae]WNH01150.1 TraI domain-containing protein [Xenorhabdus griffiniae]